MSRIKEQLKKTVRGLDDVREEPKLQTSPVVTPVDVAKVKSSGNSFEKALQDIFRNANTEFVDVKSGDLHRIVGGYPGQNHRMPTCCATMKREMRGNDEILPMPPKGYGATLIIRYFMQNTEVVIMKNNDPQGILLSIKLFNDVADRLKRTEELESEVHRLRDVYTLVKTTKVMNVVVKYGWQTYPNTNQ